MMNLTTNLKMQATTMINWKSWNKNSNFRKMKQTDFVMNMMQSERSLMMTRKQPLKLLKMHTSDERKKNFETKCFLIFKSNFSEWSKCVTRSTKCVKILEELSTSTNLISLQRYYLMDQEFQKYVARLFQSKVKNFIISFHLMSLKINLSW